ALDRCPVARACHDPQHGQRRAERRDDAESQDCLRKSQQLGDTPIYGLAEGFLQGGRTRRRNYTDESPSRRHCSVNGDVSFATPFTSTFRGILQGFPMKLVFIHLKKGPYYLMVRPEIKDIQQLKGKRIGVATIKGTDQLVAEEMLQSKGFNPNLLQAVAIGDGPVRMQALVSGAVEAICVAPPHDLMLKKMGYPALAGPPEVGLPSAGMLTSDRLIKENPLLVRRTLKALLKSHLYILENRQETVQTLIKWLPQPLDIAEHSYDSELKTLSRDGTMTDAEVEAIIARVG